MYFKKHYNNIRYPIGNDCDKGLRNAQIGAIHAIASYFTIENDNVAIVIMPTGSGKTAVLMMSPYVLQCRKVLVITPSRMVREQIAEDFSELRTLTKANVFQNDIKKPNVYELRNLYTDEYKIKCSEANVIIATPQGANSLLNTFEDEFDLVLVDEAHHSAASTWSKILGGFIRAKKILFTATPFRMDNKEIKGEIIYKYSLALAYRDEIFGEISYIPIEEDEENKDILIARKAEEIFLTDREQGYEHSLMVRTDTKAKAKMLEEIYSLETSLNLKRIDSSMSNSTAKKYIDKLKNRELDGIICVDMLGEGFDFPNLKIAAIHVAHKSLSNTLQFIGRFARTNAEKVGTAKFIAMNDEDLLLENKQLYVSDAIWQDIIIDLSESTIKKEVENKKYISEYKRTDKNIDNTNFSLYGVRPLCHAKIYKVKNFNINAKFPENCNLEMKPYINKEENTIVAIAKGLSKPKWLDSDILKNKEYLLYIVHYQKETKLLFIYSQIKSEVLYESIAESFVEYYEKIPRSEINRVLAELNNFDIFNSGMLNRYNESGESYKISAGSDVSKLIDRSTGRLYSAGHVFCKACQNDSEITIGYSSGSKIWSSAYLSLQEYIKWCDFNGRKISNSLLKVETGTNFDYLPVPKKLREYNENIFMADFDGEIYSSNPLIYIKDKEDKLNFITDLIIIVRKIEKEKIELSISLDGIEEIIECDLQGRYSIISGKEIFFVKLGSDEVTICDYLKEHPLLLRTTNDATIQGDEILEGDSAAIVYDNSNIVPIDWAKTYNTNIKIEVNDPVHHPTGKSIQDTLCEILKSDYNLKYIIYDHSRGEIADYITVEERDKTLNIKFYHVKGMKGAKYNESVNDLYEVTGQAVKSTIWLKSKQTLLEKIKSRRASNHCKFIYGEFKEFSKDIKNINTNIEGEIVIVQPSISKSTNMPLKCQEVLAAANYYITRSGKVKRLTILGSN